MATPQQGLFGLTPEQYQRQQASADQAAALKFAQLTPQQQIGLGGFTAGQQFGRFAAGLLGVEDEELKKVTLAQQAADEVRSLGVDATNPSEYYPAVIRALSSRGLTDLAQPVLKEYENWQTTALKREADQLRIWNSNPELLTREIAKAEEAGNVARVQELTAIKMRADEARKLELDKTQSQIDVNKAQIDKLRTDALNGKVTITQIPGIVRGTSILIATDSRTGKEVNRITVGEADVASSVANPETPKSDKKANPADFDRTRSNAPAAAPASSVNTSWSGVQTQAPAQTPRSAEDQLNLQLQAAYPQIPFTNIQRLNQEQKQLLARQAGLL